MQAQVLKNPDIIFEGTYDCESVDSFCFEISFEKFEEVFHIYLILPKRKRNSKFYVEVLLDTKFESVELKRSLEKLLTKIFNGGIFLKEMMTKKE